MLLLTDYPRFLYIDLRKMEVKGEIPFDTNLRVEIKNDVSWKVVTPKRVYELEDLLRDSVRWQDAVEKVRQKGKDKS